MPGPIPSYGKGFRMRTRLAAALRALAVRDTLRTLLVPCLLYTLRDRVRPVP